MNGKPLVSLIVPCYNISELCDYFFESLLRQTYTNIQLILINDGSTDNTEEKVLSFQHELEKIGFIFEYYYQENKGVGGAVNAGLKKVKGDYICWADPDDYFEDDAFDIRVKYFESHPKCMALTCDANTRMSDRIDEVINHQGDSIINHKELNQFWHLLKYESMFCPGTHMIRTEAFKKANPSMDIYESRYGQDMQLLLPIYYFYERHVLPNIVYNYIIYKNSMSHSSMNYEQKKKKIEEQLKIQIETLNCIDMPQGERDGYIHYAEVFHEKMKMYNARSYSNKSDYKRIYSKLNNENELDLKDRLRRVRFVLLGR